MNLKIQINMVSYRRVVSVFQNKINEQRNKSIRYVGFVCTLSLASVLNQGQVTKDRFSATVKMIAVTTRSVFSTSTASIYFFVTVVVSL